MLLDVENFVVLRKCSLDDLVCGLNMPLINNCRVDVFFTLML